MTNLIFDPIEEICSYDWNGSAFEEMENGMAVMVCSDETFVLKPVNTEETDCWELWRDGALMVAGAGEKCVNWMLLL